MSENIKRDIVISSTNEETRIALCENEHLVEVYIEQTDNERMLGDIYKGRVHKIIPGMKAIFVDLGMPNDAFMHFTDFENTMDDFFDDDDDDDDDEPKSKYKKASYPDPRKDIKPNDELLVQIVKEPYANKGCRITTRLTLAGRFVVLLPNQRHIGVSRKIESRDERKRLRKLAKSILPQGFGIIIRTVCEGKSETVLANDIKYLLKRWNEIEKKLKNTKAPSCVHNDTGLTTSIIRDLFTEDVNNVIVDTRKEYKILKSYIRDVAPELLSRLEYYKGTAPIFDVYFNIERDIQRSLDKKVWLKNGGYIFIEHTEALTSIDINSGRFIGKKEQDENSLKVNIDAGREIARQIRLRDIGGLIIIDFIDMRDDNNKNKLINSYKNEFKRDRAVTNIADISRFGLVEMTRQRLRPSLVHTVSDECPRCNGSGLIPSKETMLTRIERFIKRYRAQRGSRILTFKIHPELYNYLIHEDLNRAKRLMWKYWMIIKFESDESLNQESFRPFDKKMRPIKL